MNKKWKVGVERVGDLQSCECIDATTAGYSQVNSYLFRLIQ